jgi:perosamine synthetase
MIGYTSRLNTVNASIGRVQLKRLDQWNKKRRQIAKEYYRNLDDIDDLIFPLESSPGIEPVFHLFVIRTKFRNELKEWLESYGVGCGIHYALPIHLQPIYQEMFSFKEGSYPNSEELCKTCLSLPMYPDLELSDVKYISEKIHDFFSAKR